MIRGLIGKGIDLGLGVAKFALREVKERVGRRDAPHATAPAAPERAANMEHAIDESEAPAVPVLDVRKVREEIDSATPSVLLDCRERHEWEAGYIRGCVHIPMNDLPGRLAELDATRRTIVYCLHGMRSAQVAGWLATKGFRDVVSLDGGIVSWYSEFDQDRIVVRRSEEI